MVPGQDRGCHRPRSVQGLSQQCTRFPWTNQLTWRQNIPRGKGVERDNRADNPFIDTVSLPPPPLPLCSRVQPNTVTHSQTEYIMNKMIQRQELVPPWIEKQQELLRTAKAFRSRLHSDWKRHAARMIASRGGTLQQQMARAQEYARAEEIHNPRRRNVEHISVPTNSTADAVMAAAAAEAAPATSSSPPPPDPSSTTTSEPTTTTTTTTTNTLSRPYRDPAWEAHQRSYMDLAVANLNSITRSYNLMAPELAKKPYFSVQRELDRCFADVAPLLADEIKARAARPAGGPSLLDGLGKHNSSSAFGRFNSEQGGQAKVYDSRAPQYGFKEMWRDLFGKGKG